MSTSPTGKSDLNNEEYLEVSRNNMFTALDLFLRHTQYSITLLVSMLTASFAIVAFSIERFQISSAKWRIAFALGSAVLFLMGPISYLLQLIVTRYFRLYVSSYVYAARLHERASSTIQHPWFEEINDKIIKSTGGKNDINSPSAVDDYLGSAPEQIAKKFNQNNWLYRYIIGILGIVGFILGIFGFIYLLVVVFKSPIVTVPCWFV